MSEAEKDLKQVVQDAVPRKAFTIEPVTEAVTKAVTGAAETVTKTYDAAVEKGADVYGAARGKGEDMADRVIAEVQPKKLADTYTDALSAAVGKVDQKVAMLGEVLLEKAAALEDKHYVSTAIVLEKAGQALTENYGTGEMKSSTNEAVTTVSAVAGFATGTVLMGLAASNPVTAVPLIVFGGLVGTFMGATGGKAAAGAVEASIEGIKALPDAFASRHVGTGRAAVEKALESGAVTVAKKPAGPAM